MCFPAHLASSALWDYTSFGCGRKYAIHKKVFFMFAYVITVHVFSRNCIINYLVSLVIAFNTSNVLMCCCCCFLLLKISIVVSALDVIAAYCSMRACRSFASRLLSDIVKLSTCLLSLFKTKGWCIHYITSVRSPRWGFPPIKRWKNQEHNESEKNESQVVCIVSSPLSRNFQHITTLITF